MTDIDLDAIEARANAATEGPWWRREGHAEINGQNYAEVLIPGRVECGSYCYGGRSTIEGDRLDADLAFIAHARADVPDLVAEVRRLRESLDEGFAAIALAGAEIERASVEVDRAHRALLASNAERDDASAAIARVRALDPADHATSSRDYGRGYAQALRDSLRALDGDA